MGRGTRSAPVGTIGNPQRLDSLEVSPGSRAVLDKIQRDRENERARLARLPSLDEIESMWRRGTGTLQIGDLRLREEYDVIEGDGSKWKLFSGHAGIKKIRIRVGFGDFKEISPGEFRLTTLSERGAQEYANLLRA